MAKAYLKTMRRRWRRSMRMRILTISLLRMIETSWAEQASYYPHGVTYCAMGYTFLQDFLDCLDCELLENILA
jgi:hypothetical protein